MPAEPEFHKERFLNLHKDLRVQAVMYMQDYMDQQEHCTVVPDTVEVEVQAGTATEPVPEQVFDAVAEQASASEVQMRNTAVQE